MVYFSVTGPATLPGRLFFTVVSVVSMPVFYGIYSVFNTTTIRNISIRNIALFVLIQYTISISPDGTN
jgi:hypothetical protein